MKRIGCEEVSKSPTGIREAVFLSYACWIMLFAFLLQAGVVMAAIEDNEFSRNNYFRAATFDELVRLTPGCARAHIRGGGIGASPVAVISGKNKTVLDFGEINALYNHNFYRLFGITNVSSDKVEVKVLPSPEIEGTVCGLKQTFTLGPGQTGHIHARVAPKFFEGVVGGFILIQASGYTSKIPVKVGLYFPPMDLADKKTEAAAEKRLKSEPEEVVQKPAMENGDLPAGGWQ